MMVVGYRDYQPTANIYTHLKEDSLAAADMASVFKKKKAANHVKKAIGGGNSWNERFRYRSAPKTRLSNTPLVKRLIESLDDI